MSPIAPWMTGLETVEPSKNFALTPEEWATQYSMNPHWGIPENADRFWTAAQIEAILAAQDAERTRIEAQIAAERIARERSYLEDARDRS